MKEKIILYIFNKKDIDKYCRAISPNDWEELKSELIVQLYKMDEEKLLEAYNNKFLEYKCFTMIKNISNGNVIETGIFRTDKLNYGYIPDDVIIEEELVLDFEHLHKLVIEEVGSKHWYDKTLFLEFYVNKLKLREISEKYGINLKTIQHTISKLKKKIKKRLERDGDNFRWS
jgi:hypothetical protein